MYLYLPPFKRNRPRKEYKNILSQVNKGQTTASYTSLEYHSVHEGFLILHNLAQIFDEEKQLSTIY